MYQEEKMSSIDHDAETFVHLCTLEHIQRPAKASKYFQQMCALGMIY
jgi:hypothetical protein